MFKTHRLLILLVLLFSLNNSVFPFENPPVSQKIRIVTSIFPLLEFVQAVAGDKGEVSLLLPPGANVHTWQPRPSDIIHLSSCDLFVHVGANLEPWIPGVLRSLPDRKFVVLEVAKNLSLIKNSAEQKDHGDEESDPHIWLDFGNDQIIINRIRDALSGLAPDYASFFRINAEIYNEKLQKLDEKFRLNLAGCRHRTFILGGHAAFGYLARRYHLKQINLYGMSPDGEPQPRELLRVIKSAKEEKAKAVFFEANMNPKLAKVVAEELRARMLMLNAGHNLTKKQRMRGVTFFDIMEENLKNLKEGLICD